MGRIVYCLRRKANIQQLQEHIDTPVLCDTENRQTGRQADDWKTVRSTEGPGREGDVTGDGKTGRGVTGSDETGR